LLRTHSLVLFAVHEIPQNFSRSFHLKGVKTCFFILSSESSFHSRMLLQATLALSLVEIGML